MRLFDFLSLLLLLLLLRLLLLNWLLGSYSKGESSNRLNWCWWWWRRRTSSDSLLLLLLLLGSPIESKTAERVVSQLISRVLGWSRLGLVHHRLNYRLWLRGRGNVLISLDYLVLVVLVQGVSVSRGVISRVASVRNNILVSGLGSNRSRVQRSIVTKSRPTAGGGQTVIRASGITRSVRRNTDNVATKETSRKKRKQN